MNEMVTALVPHHAVLAICADPNTLHLVDLYFLYIHDQPHSLFHEPSFKASVASGTVSRIVLLAMMGLSARYLHSSPLRLLELLFTN